MYVGLVDRPGGRKNHEGVVPLCGGLAILIAFCSVVFCYGLIPANDYLGLIVGAAALAIIGGLDDFRGLSVHLRLLVQISVVLSCMGLWGKTELVSVGDLLGLGQIQLGPTALPFTLFAVVGVINAFNFSDGIDGLAGGLAAIAFTSIAVAALTAGEGSFAALATVLTGALLGFLVFNLRTSWRTKASVFMGDAGTLFLGFALCWFTIKLSQGDERAISPVTAGWILGLPIMDALSVMSCRILRGESPFRAGRDHLHHALLEAGYSPRQTVNVLLIVGGGMNVIALATHYLAISESLMFFTLMGLFTMYVYALRQFRRSRLPAAAASVRTDPGRVAAPHADRESSNPNPSQIIAPIHQSYAPLTKTDVHDIDSPLADLRAASSAVTNGRDSRDVHAPKT